MADAGCQIKLGPLIQHPVSSIQHPPPANPRNPEQPLRDENPPNSALSSRLSKLSKVRRPNLSKLTIGWAGSVRAAQPVRPEGDSSQGGACQHCPTVEALRLGVVAMRSCRGGEHLPAHPRPALGATAHR